MRQEVVVEVEPVPKRFADDDEIWAAVVRIGLSYGGTEPSWSGLEDSITKESNPPTESVVESKTDVSITTEDVEIEHRAKKPRLQDSLQPTELAVSESKQPATPIVKKRGFSCLDMPVGPSHYLKVPCKVCMGCLSPEERLDYLSAVNEPASVSASVPVVTYPESEVSRE
eukprot:GHVU01113277.1.p1 GENE.GHVU01113277.1~~GHVU01113277.1.p1  ORF type:complete len:170 (-),score=13.15 GHVU01113277.1:598-1107(-)